MATLARTPTPRPQADAHPHRRAAHSHTSRLTPAHLSPHTRTPLTPSHALSRPLTLSHALSNTLLPARLNPALRPRPRPLQVERRLHAWLVWPHQCHAASRMPSWHPAAARRRLQLASQLCTWGVDLALGAVAALALLRLVGGPDASGAPSGGGDDGGGVGGVGGVSGVGDVGGGGGVGAGGGDGGRSLLLLLVERLAAADRVLQDLMEWLVGSEPGGFKLNDKLNEVRVRLQPHAHERLQPHAHERLQPHARERLRPHAPRRSARPCCACCGHGTPCCVRPSCS